MTIARARKLGDDCREHKPDGENKQNDCRRDTEDFFKACHSAAPAQIVPEASDCFLDDNRQDRIAERPCPLRVSQPEIIAENHDSHQREKPGKCIDRKQDEKLHLARDVLKPPYERSVPQ